MRKELRVEHTNLALMQYRRLDITYLSELNRLYNGSAAATKSQAASSERTDNGGKRVYQDPQDQ